MTTDILAIGDITTDNFIRLKESELEKHSAHDSGPLCLEMGNKIPYEYAEETPGVGNAANVAVGVSRLGLKSAILAYIGDDLNGQKCLAELQKNNVDTSLVRVEIGKHTNYHYALWYGVDRTILVKHEIFSYDLGEIEPPKWLYLTSLRESSLPFHGQIADFLDKNPEVKLAFQPGTFQIKMGAEVLVKIYKRTDAFFCNVEEAREILKNEAGDVATLLRSLGALGPKNVFITDGMKGAHGFDGTNIYFMPSYPHQPYERTGAGDAFALTIVAYMEMGKTFLEALTRAPINSMSVVQQVGAQKGLLSHDKIEDHLSKAPADYKAQLL